MSDRHTIRQFPLPYYAGVSPYLHLIDFSKTAYALERQSRFRAPSTRPQTCKAIFVGDVAVGKSTIINRFCFRRFKSIYKATVGVDFEIENFSILDQNFILEMWDTAGQERFKCIAHAYYKNARVVVIVFDMSNLATLETVPSWLRRALDMNPNRRPLVFLVGTKSDLLSPMEVKRVERIAIEIAREIKAEYWTVSSQTNSNIVEFFQRMAALAFEESLELMLSADKRENSGKFKLCDNSKKSQKTGFSKRFSGSEKNEKRRNYCAC